MLMRPDGNARGETVEVTEPIENPARHAQRAPMNQERGQGREIHHALRTAFWVLAVAIGLWGLYLAQSEWRAFPAWSLLLAAYLLVAGPGAVAWCWRQLARLVGRDPDKVAPDWLGDGPLPSLDELGEDAAIVLECDEDLLERPFERRPHHTALDLVIRMYAHDRCDWFAYVLREATGWPVVEAASPRKPSAHRLNRDPQGRLVDAYGHVTLDDLRQRYGIGDLEIVEDAVIRRDFAPDRRYLARLGCAMLYLPWEPFASMRGALEAWVRHGHVACAAPSAVVQPPTTGRTFD
jgi:hypothetical protein